MDPARTIEESLTSDPGIREQNRHGTDQARCLLSSRYRGVSGLIADMLRPPSLTHKRHMANDLYAFRVIDSDGIPLGERSS